MKIQLNSVSSHREEFIVAIFQIKYILRFRYKYLRHFFI